jgi:hypothetical protein
LNTYQDQLQEDYYDYHPEAVTATVSGVGSCKGLFDYSYQGAERDKAGNKKQTLQAHFVAYIGNSALFVDKRNVSVTIEGNTYKIANAELLETQGAVSVWLV